MQFTSIPREFSSFNEPLIYAFDTGTAGLDVEFNILNCATYEVIGTKRLYGVTQGEIDIAPYLRQVMTMAMPDGVEQCGEVELNQNIQVVVEADGVTSESRHFVAAKIDQGCGYKLLTTQVLHRTMTCDEFDIVGFFSQGTTVEVVVESFGIGTDGVVITPAGEGQRAVVITAQDWGEATQELRVTIMVDGIRAEQITYSIKSNLNGARRLAWVNRYQMPELYTFPLRKGVLIKATRKHMEKVWGREAATLESENELKLISAYEPVAQIRALAEILGSKRVWLVEGSALQSVNLLTDRVLSAPAGEMGMIEVDVRAAEEGVRLW